MNFYLHTFNTPSNSLHNSLFEESKEYVFFTQNHPDFHKQFSIYNDEVTLEFALDNLQRMSQLDVVTLPFNYQSCYAYNNFILNSKREFFKSDFSERKGEVFVELIKEMNDIVFEIYQKHILPDEMEGVRLKVFADLMILVKYLNKKKAFVDLNLSGLNLSQLNLNNLDFNNLALDLSYADFTGAKLESANFTNTILKNAIFFNADMNQMILNGAIMLNADMTNANLQHADLTDAKLNGGMLKMTNLMHATLTKTNLSDADLDGAELSHTKKDGIILTGVKNYPQENLVLQINDKPKIDSPRDGAPHHITATPEVQIKNKHAQCCVII